MYTYTHHTHTQKADNTLLNHIFDNIEDYKGNHFDDLHHHLFNEDYFIIGYYKAEVWIKENDLNIFELIKFCQEQEKENFGEISNTFDNSEKLVNHYAYWRGQELLDSLKSVEDFTGGGWGALKYPLYVSDRLIKEIKEEINLSYDMANSFK